MGPQDATEREGKAAAEAYGSSYITPFYDVNEK